MAILLMVAFISKSPPLLGFKKLRGLRVENLK